MTNPLWPLLEGKRVLLGVTGGVAAYKAAELCRLLSRCGAEVRVMMTAAATQFVGPTTFAALSNHAVALSLFDATQEAQIGHIGLADWAELVVIAPATADFLAKLRAGLADDLPSTVCLAHTKSLLLAPAMNVHMWEHAATQENLAMLQQRGNRIVGPGSGEMACGHQGAGRMAEPEEILGAVGAGLAPQDLIGRRVLVSAGPTHEPIDPVRFIGNRSSGKMGFALAAEAACRGALVTLVAGPSSLPTPWGVARHDVTTARQMAEVILRSGKEQDAIFMTAAVADYRPGVVSSTKIKKEQTGDQLTLVLERNQDILASLGARPRLGRPLLVGFAAETGADLLHLAPAKLAAKGCDLLVANDVLAADAGFEVDTNRVVLFDTRGGAEELPLLSKRKIAQVLLERVARMLLSRTVERP
jgi:phosphopantothenoylcysteine decarboxylase / phosphopantothenate---cysteine ligase